MINIKSPNVVQISEYFEDESNIYIVMEFCDDNLNTQLMKETSGKGYTEAEAL